MVESERVSRVFSYCFLWWAASSTGTSALSESVAVMFDSCSFCTLYCWSPLVDQLSLLECAFWVSCRYMHRCDFQWSVSLQHNCKPDCAAERFYHEISALFMAIGSAVLQATWPMMSPDAELFSGHLLATPKVSCPPPVGP